MFVFLVVNVVWIDELIFRWFVYVINVLFVVGMFVFVVLCLLSVIMVVVVVEVLVWFVLFGVGVGRLRVVGVLRGCVGKIENLFGFDCLFELLWLYVVSVVVIIKRLISLCII